MIQLRGCSDWREAVAALVMGALPGEDVTAVQRHLQSCEECHGLYESLRRQEPDLLWTFERIGRPTKAPVSCVHQPAPARGLKAWIVARAMRVARGVVAVRPVGRMAIAAAILIGVIGVWALSLQSGRRADTSFSVLAKPTYADVLQQIDRARSVYYTKTVEIEGELPMTMQQTVREGGYVRTVWPDGGIMIDHYASGDRLHLNPRRRSAQLSHSLQDDRPRLMNLADWIKTLHEHNGVFSRQEVLDGRSVNIYKVDRPYEMITVWADASTRLPVRVERVMRPCTDKDIRVPEMDLSTSDFVDEADQDEAGGGTGISTKTTFWDVGVLMATRTTTYSDFTWNAEYDDSLFDLTPPADYRVDKFNWGDSVADEESLVEALRFWAQTSEGRFPEDINMLADSKPNLVRQYRSVGSPEEALEKATPMMHTVLAGMAFAQSLKVQDNWHYAGKDVVLGEADKPLCWWHLKDSEMDRVVYGDLTIRDVRPEDLPQPVIEAPATQP
jgi:hypothetical protein